jgi:hypothetical protein
LQPGIGGYERLRTLARPAVVWTAGTAGLLAYNWWVLAPLKPGLIRSPDEFFSNLEVAGHPYAAVMQHADVLAGLLMLVAFLVAGNRNLPGSRFEWLSMVVFSIAGGVGGMFSQACADGINATCLNMEWQFRLPASQYIHDGAGMVEFAAITFALGHAVLRTWHERTPVASSYRWLAIAAALAYPFLFVAYVFDTLGAVAEAVFFVGFAVMVVTQLVERTRRRYDRRDIVTSRHLLGVPERQAVAEHYPAAQRERIVERERIAEVAESGRRI